LAMIFLALAVEPAGSGFLARGQAQAGQE
jgi:hypothetical protein